MFIDVEKLRDVLLHLKKEAVDPTTEMVEAINESIRSCEIVIKVTKGMGSYVDRLSKS